MKNIKPAGHRSHISKGAMHLGKNGVSKRTNDYWYIKGMRKIFGRNVQII